jgi:hypothetical protein
MSELVWWVPIFLGGVAVGFSFCTWLNDRAWRKDHESRATHQEPVE